MTREEQINKAGNTIAGTTAMEGDTGFDIGFMLGAQWADENPRVSPWIPLDGKHKEPPYGRAIAVYYPIRGGVVDLVERKIQGEVTEHGHDRNYIDANGLPMVAEHSRAAYLGCYTVHATMYMDIPDPITENENNQFK